jgi:hypothetical protein
VRDFDLDFRALWRSRAARNAREKVTAAPCACESSNTSYPNALLDPRSALSVARWAWRAR